MSKAGRESARHLLRTTLGDNGDELLDQLGLLKLTLEQLPQLDTEDNILLAATKNGLVAIALLLEYSQ